MPLPPLPGDPKSKEIADEIRKALPEEVRKEIMNLKDAAAAAATVLKTPQLLVKKLTPDAMIPKRGSEEAAGYDLYANGDWKIPGRSVVAISTGVAIQIPFGYVGLFRDRSGLASKAISTHAIRLDRDAVELWLKDLKEDETVGYGENVLGGVIDSDYRGELKVLLYNATDKEFKVTKGDRVAQFLIIPVARPDVIVCETFPINETVQLSETVRGEGGLGSTGR